MNAVSCEVRTDILLLQSLSCSILFCTGYIVKSFPISSLVLLWPESSKAFICSEASHLSDRFCLCLLPRHLLTATHHHTDRALYILQIQLSTLLRSVLLLLCSCVCVGSSGDFKITVLLLQSHDAKANGLSNCLRFYRPIRHSLAFTQPPLSQ
jgi:hypothetical protein